MGDRLLPSMFQMNAGYFLIQLASEKDKEKVCKDIGSSIRKDANGVKQVCSAGIRYSSQYLLGPRSFVILC